MNSPGRKPIYKKFMNIKVALNYFKEAFHVISQGKSASDKLILLFYYFKSPLILFKSILWNKEIREIEENHKLLLKEVTLSNENGIFYCGKNILTVYIADQAYQQEFNPYMMLTEGVFVDVGAHIGKYSIELARRLKNSGRVIAIEPEKNNFEMLIRNTALNNLGNITCINKCAYSEKGTLNFYTSGQEGEGEHSLIQQSGLTGIQATEADTLDNIFSELNISKADLIKIDVEGTESEVLKGAQKVLGSHPKLLIETWNEEGIKKIITFLSAFGYKEPVRIDSINYFFR